MRPFIVGLMLAGSAVHAAAQASDSAARATAPSNAAVERARRLVNEGRGAEGRALLDSLVRTLPPGSPDLGRVLLWRAMTAATAQEAEADLRRVTVEFALTPPAETALVRLAQMEMQRGDRAAAFTHLQRLMVEYTTPGARARAAYWMGRLHRDGGDEAKACEAFGSAKTWTPPADVELANQVEYAARRCPAMPAVAAASVPVVSPPAAAPPASTQRPVEPPTVTVNPPTFPAPAPRTDTAPSVSRDTTSRAASAGARPTAGAATATAAPTAAAPSAPARDTSIAAVRHFSVQIAAYSTQPDAERLAESYRKGGAEARVDGTAAPFRVRVGRYATREEANKVAEDFRRRGQAAFVVVVDPR